MVRKNKIKFFYIILSEYRVERWVTESFTLTERSFTVVLPRARVEKYILWEIIKKTFFNGAYYRFTIIHERRPIFYELDRFVYECVKSTRIPGCKVIHVDGDKKDNDNDNLDVEEIKEIEEDEE